MPLVAILRGLQASRAPSVARALVDAGFRIIEVPLNREGALYAIDAVRRAVPDDTLVGAGTVLTPAQVHAAHAAGARLIVAPNLDAAVMAEGRALGLALMPGVMTPSEAFAARRLGVDALKLFPAEVIGPAGLNALRSVLPRLEASIYPVGGVTAETMSAWREAGADGFGIGGSLFAPELNDRDIAVRAQAFVAAWRAVEGRIA